MKIVVASKKSMRSQYYSDKTWYSDPNKYFISIAGVADGCEYPCPFLTKDSKRVLHLLFDDVTEIEKDNPSVILFNEDHANKIKDFIQTIPNEDNITVYVNCAAGISRSGAVGYILNEYFNKDNNEAYKQFQELNSHIQPNPMVKRILNDIVFGKVDYEAIFK